MEFTGKWRSLLFESICGVFTMTISELSMNTNITCEMKLSYDSTSSYMPNKTVNIELDGIYKCDDNAEEKYRIIMKQKQLSTDQYFTLTIVSIDMMNWGGYLTCIMALDVALLFDIQSTETFENDQIDDYDISICI